MGAQGSCLKEKVLLLWLLSYRKILFLVTRGKIVFDCTLKSRSQTDSVDELTAMREELLFRCRYSIKCNVCVSLVFLCVLVAQQSCLIETVLLSTHEACVGVPSFENFIIKVTVIPIWCNVVYNQFSHIWVPKRIIHIQRRFF